MTRPRTAGWRPTLFLLGVVLILGVAPASSALTPAVALAQDISVDPKTASPTAGDLRQGFQFVPEKSEQREPVPGIIVYEADFVRDQTPQNFANGPIEIKSLVAKTANSQQAAEQFTSSRQALTSASPPWVESKVAKLGDESTGLTMEGISSDGQPAVAHLFLFRRGAMVVGITVAGLTKPTRMAEAEAIAAVVLRKIDPDYKNQTGPRQARQLNTQKPTSTAVGTGNTNLSSNTGNTGETSQRVRVANTDGTNLNLRAQPSQTASIAAKIPPGTVLEVVGEDRQAEGITWKNVRAPGDGRGWVAAQYTTPVTGSASTPTSTGATTSPTTNTNAAPTQPGTTSTTGETLKVDVKAKSAEVKVNQEQTVEIVVTRNGQPVSGAQVTVKTSPTGETPPAPPTDASGKTTVTWKPTGSPGFIGIGVSALTPDGSAGVGGASFQLSN